MISPGFTNCIIENIGVESRWGHFYGQLDF